MADLDDEQPKKKPSLQIDLSHLSIAELEERITDLRAEIERCEAAIGSKQSSRVDAESVFKR